MVSENEKLRVIRYHTKQIKRGLKQIRVWLPEQKVEHFQKQAERARKKHFKEMGEI